MDHRQALSKGAVVGGDYEIERVLGSGGFGITYLARDKGLGIQVAIKEYFPASLAYREAGATVSASTDSNLDSYNWGLERFLAEARTLARLRHPNIVRVSRYFKENGTAYMVLGFVVGQDLEAWLAARGRRPTQKELDALVGPLIDALEIVHKADVVHRDIKPANIYIQKSDGAPVLLDFGAARQALSEQTRATAAFVSPGYSPPESHENDPAAQGPWTDIYGLAATLYRAVVGKAPAQVINRLSRDTYVPLAQQIDKPGDYRPGFLAAIDKGMMLRREDRPQSVTAWRALLFGDLSEQDTEVRRPDDTVVVTRPSPSQADTVVRSLPSAAWSPNARRAIAGALALAGLAALYYIYASFEQPRDNRAGSGAEIASPNPPTGGEAAGTPPASTQAATFVPYKNARFGYELAYPTGILVPDAPPQNGGGQSFTSPDGTFQINSFASFNSDGATPESLRRQLQSDDPRFQNASVTASADNGFTLVANNENRVNGYVAIFTCGNQLLNVLEISFPASGLNFATHRDLANRVIESFQPGQGEDGPADCSSSSALPAHNADAAQSNFNEPQPTGLFADPSLRRLAVYGWSAGGIQNGLWAAGINSNSGVLLNVKCNDGPGNSRSGIVELQNVPTGANPLSGEHQVDVEIGNYVDGAAFTFSPAQDGSNGQLQITETNESGGEYLAFLRQLASGQTMTLRIPSANYQERFNLFAADRALGPCLGQSIAQPWVDQGERDGVIGTGVRNASGGAFYIRCDTTPQTRGNVILAFAARQRPGIQTQQLETIKAFIETQFIDLEFNVVQEPNVLTGVIYHVAADSGTSNIASFLELLSRGNQLRLLNPDLGVDETFSLTGSRRTLEGCAGLY